MHLDVGTLSVVTVFVTALLGALLVFAGLQNRSIRAPMWWGAAQIVGAVGLGLATSRGVIPDFLSIDIANALVLLAYGLTWAGARNFDGRRVLPLVVVFAPAVWLMICRTPGFVDDVNLRIVVVSAMMAMLAAATAEEFWRGRDEPLMSRWPTVIVLLAYAAALLARIPATYFSPLLGHSVMGGVSFALIAFGTLLFTVVMSFLLLNMTKERTELQHKINAMVDPLSGVANRRAFLDGAKTLLARQALDGEPLAMLLFDLDRFKEINDRMGHAVGDRVLQTFAAATTSTLGTDVLFGRIGGEEFASLIPVGDLGEGYAIADRVRRNFVEAAARFANGDLKPTVSVGVTLGVDATTGIDILLDVADRALYRAKANGRNRVEATAPLDEQQAPFASAPSIVPLIGPERAAVAGAAAGRRRVAR
jgi:diguanylate cyclase (GGDEF)-like protein